MTAKSFLKPTPPSLGGSPFPWADPYQGKGDPPRDGGVGFRKLLAVMTNYIHCVSKMATFLFFE